MKMTKERAQEIPVRVFGQQLGGSDPLPCRLSCTPRWLVPEAQPPEPGAINSSPAGAQVTRHMAGENLSHAFLSPRLPAGRQAGALSSEANLSGGFRLVRQGGRARPPAIS